MTRRQDEGGFTLVELVIAVAVSAAVLGGLGTGLMAVLRLSGATTDRIAATHDLEQLRRFLVADVHSADATTSVVPHAPAAGEAGCATGDPVDGFSMRWSNPATGKRYRAGYARSGTDLQRTLAEVDAAGTPTSTLRTDTVVHNLQDPALGAGDLGGFAGRFPLCMATGQLPIVSLAVTVLIREGSKPASEQLGFPVKVVPRTGEYALGNPTGTTAPPALVTPIAPTATLTSPTAGSAFRGNLTTTATASATATLGQLGIEHQPGGSSTWTPVEATPCTSSPCSMVLRPGPIALADGPLQLRAWAKDALGQTVTSAPITVTHDSTGPSGTWTSPAAGAVLKGSFGLAVEATDATSGVQSVAFARGPAPLATATTPTTGASYVTTFDPAGVPDGATTFTATVTDRAGNSAQVVRSVTLDNTGPSGAITAPAPGSKRKGVVAVTGTAQDAASGVASATVQLRAAGASTWVDVGTRTAVAAGAASGAFSVDVASTSFPDGQAEVRAVLVDGLGSTSTTAATAFVIDNLRPRATSIALVAAGKDAGRLDAGDRVVITFSEAIDPGTVCGGLSTSAAVTVTVADGGSSDALTVDGCGLGTVAIPSAYGSPNGQAASVSYGSAQAPSTIAWDAAARTVTVTLGKEPSNPPGGVAAGTVTYAPGSGITDQASNPIDTGAVSAGSQRF